MAQVNVIVDSSSDIPQRLADELGITIIPMPVAIEGQSFLEGVDLNIDDFYAGFKHLSALPTTSQPNLGDVVEYYKKAAEGGNGIVAIHLSSGLSGTVQTAKLAKTMLEDEGLEIAVVDSLGASFGVGLLAIRAAQIAKGSAELSDIVQAVEQDKLNMRYVFTPDNLEHLIKGGRVGKLSGAVGTLLDVKPLLKINSEGKIEAFGKVRGRKPALRKLAETLASEICPSQQTIGIAHSMCQTDAEILAEEIRNKTQITDILISRIGCTIGSHTGPGCVALFYRAQN